MKRWFPLLAGALLAACAPAPQQPAALDPAPPVAEPIEEPATELPRAEEPIGAPGGATVTQLEPPEVEVTPDAPAEAEAAGETEAPAETPAAPQGTISISADGETFVTGEDNPVTVAAGGTFSLRLEFSDPDGISDLGVELRNSEFAGALPTGPFSVTASDCEAQLAGAPTEVSCTLEVAIAPDAQPIDQEGEFAYAFRPSATDSLGNSALAFSWAYLIVEPL
jgi:hypothetical protein